MWHFLATVWQISARLCAGIAATDVEDDRAMRGRRALGDRDGGITAAKGVMPLVISRRLVGENDHPMDCDSVGGVGRSTRALGRSNASMSETGAILLIFVMVAIALTTVKRRGRKNL